VNFTGKALSFAAIPIFTRIFTPEDFGVMSLLGMLSGLAWPILEMGMDCGVELYFYREKDIDKRNGMIFSGLIFILVWATLLTIVLALSNKPISRIMFRETSYSGLIKLVIVVSYLNCFINYCKYLLRLGMEAWKFVCVTVVYNFLGVGFGIYLVLVRKSGIPGIYWGQFFACFAALAMLTLWTTKYFSLKFSITAVGKFLKVGIPYVPTALVYIFATYVDRICLSRLSNLSEVGLYAVSIKLSSIIAMLRGMFQMAWNPIRLKIYHNNEDYQQTYRAVMSGALIIFSFIAVFITAVRHEALFIFTTSKYFGAHAAVGPLCIAEAVRGCYAVALVGIYVTMKTYWMLIFASISLVVNVLLNVILIPILGITGAAIATFVSMALIVIMAYIISQRLVESIRFDWKRDIGILAVSILAIGLFYLTDLVGDHWLRLGLNLAIVFVFPGLLFLFGIVDTGMVRKGLAMARSKIPL